MALKDHIRSIHQQHFVGREAERVLFRELVQAPAQSTRVLYIYGPGGVGKTSLLQTYVADCQTLGLRPLRIDGRQVKGRVRAFRRACALALGIRKPLSTDALHHAFDALNEPCALIIDTAEQLAGISDWLRERFLPDLPDTLFIVMAGRQRLSDAWIRDPAWRELIHVCPLRNFSPDETRAYLQQRHIDAAHYEAILDFTYGHPMALSLVADVYAQQGALDTDFADDPNLIQALVDRFVQQVPDEAHLMALEASAVVRFLTEPLLAHLTGTAQPHTLFKWLRNLSFVEVRRAGLYPHDLARGVLLADLRWRNMDRYRNLRDRARSYYAERLQAAHSAQEQRRLLSDYTFLHHENPFLRPLFAHLNTDVHEHEAIYTEPAAIADYEAISDLVGTSEGAEAKQYASEWLRIHPEAAILFRNTHNQILGFTLHLRIEAGHTPPSSADPLFTAVDRHLRIHTPLRRSECATLLRFWATPTPQHDLSYVPALMFVDAIRAYLQTRHLAYSVIATPYPDVWAPIFEQLHFHTLDADPVQIGHTTYTLYGHDWRGEPPQAWLAQLAERDLSVKTPPSTLAAPPIAVLDEAAFAKAVRHALKHYSRPAHLSHNPLLQARCVLDRTPPQASNDSERIEALRSLIRDTLATMNVEHGRLLKLHRALKHTYITPAPTQELAAERLDLPFSTYRRHLQHGLQHLTDALWRIELGG
ncbi:MAG: ATP-binding protein [Rhodothermales bacterium]